MTFFIDIPYAALKLSALVGLIPLDKGYLAYSAVQAGLKHFEVSNPKLFLLMQKVKAAFLLVDFGATFWSIGKLALVLDAKTLFLSSSESVFFGLGSYAGVAAWIAIGIGAVYVINRLMKPSKDPNDLIEAQGNAEVKADYQRPAVQKFEQWMYVTRIVVTVALACFTPGGGIIFGVSAAFQTYSLIKISQWKWVRFTAMHLGKAGDSFKSITLYYYCLFLPNSKSKTEDDCAAYCPDAKPDVHFCKEHVIHQLCAMKHIFSKCQDLFNKFIYYQNIHTTDKGHRYAIYELVVPEAVIPNCPLCRAQPIYNEMSITVQDRIYGASNGTLNSVSEKEYQGRVEAIQRR